MRKDIYETPCYSIENFYVSVTCFKKILNTGFNFERYVEADEEIFDQCLKYFIDTQNKFHEAIAILNAWMMQVRDTERKKEKSERNIAQFNNLKFIDLFKIEIDNVKCKCNIEDYLEKKFPQIEYVSYDQLHSIIKDIRSRSCVFRGKFELAFLNKFLRILIENLKKN
ncbi:hypothetical protein MHK_009620 [Candidatus Magnetomorum sp. HK-1]|nr:hypothetical protein MHK_009620 [Candidatus Magnetomorum sp. HK-1]